MTWVFAILVGVVLGVVATVAAGRTGFLPEAESRLGAELPERGLGAGDLRTVRFSLAFRGYRMSEVDALLDRVADQWESEHREADPGSSGRGDVAGG